MLIDEASAKLKFCPLGRGVVPLNKDGKFAAGVNMSPGGHLTQCEGSACMLWETQQVINAPHPCPECGNLDDKRESCKTCEGKGTYLKQHTIGFCGAGFQGPLAAGIADLNKTLAAILVTVRGQQQKQAAANDGNGKGMPEEPSA